MHNNTAIVDEIETIVIPPHLDASADLDSLHYPKLKEGQGFLMYTNCHFEIELQLTPCARLLWRWILLRAPAGVATNIDLRNFQAVSAEQRRGKPYCMRQVRNAFKELENLGLLIDKTDKRRVVARHPGPVTNNLPDPATRKLISKIKKLTSTDENLTSTPPYIYRSEDLSDFGQEGENLNGRSSKENEAVVGTVELIATLQAQINALNAKLDSQGQFFAAGHQGNISVTAKGHQGDVDYQAAGHCGDVDVHGTGHQGDVVGEHVVGHCGGINAHGTGHQGDVVGEHLKGHVGNVNVHAVGHKGNVSGTHVSGHRGNIDAHASGHKGDVVSACPKEIWEIAPGHPYPTFLNWKEAINRDQGGHWEKNAAAFAYSEFYNHRARTSAILWPQFMAEVRQVCENANQLRAAGMQIILPSWFAVSRPDVSEANVQQLLSNLESLLPEAKVALPQGTATPSCSQAIGYEQATDTSVRPLPTLQPQPALPGKKLLSIAEIQQQIMQQKTC